jgi:hypothetical protein
MPPPAAMAAVIAAWIAAVSSVVLSPFAPYSVLTLKTGSEPPLAASFSFPVAESYWTTSPFEGAPKTTS